MRLRGVVRKSLPPVLLRLLRALRSHRQDTPEWEYIPEGWAYAQSHPDVRGWDVSDIVDVYRHKWPRFAQLVQGSGPLGVSHVSPLTSNENVSSHNTIMIYAYVLTLATRHKDRIGLLDWGGGIGHHYLLARSILPEVEIDYHCRDLPYLCSYGAQLFPDQSFFFDDRWIGNTYDLVMASSSLQYAEEWRELLFDLCRVTSDLLFITDLPVVRRAPSFVFIQRPYHLGYNTEYIGWCLNEQELVRAVSAGGLTLRREFILGFKPVIRGAPEQNVYRGYLFQRRADKS